MSSSRSSGFPWGPLPRRMTPKPMPSWMAPRRPSVTIPAVRPSVRPAPAAEPVELPIEPPPASSTNATLANAADIEPPPGSQREVKIEILEEEEDPQLEALRLQNAQLETALAEAIAENTRQRKHILEASEKELVKLAVAIAEHVVGRELALDPGLPIHWAKQAIALLGADDEEIVIAVSPEVEPLISKEKWLETVPNASVVVDAALKPGHTQVRAGMSRIGAGHADRLAAVLEALGEAAR